MATTETCFFIIQEAFHIRMALLSLCLIQLFGIFKFRRRSWPWTDCALPSHFKKFNFNQFPESIIVFACRSVRQQRLNICLSVESIPLKICCSCIFMKIFHWFQDCLQNLRVIFAMAWFLPFY